MRQRHLIAFLAAAALAACAVASSAEAATVNTSRSNSLKTAADCSKAGGKWMKGNDGLGCYLPVKTEGKPK